MVIKSTQATIQVEQPATIQLSDKPLKGSYRITCPFTGNDLTSSPITTEDIDLGTHERWIREAISKNCSGYYDRIDVWKSGDYYSVVNGIGLYIRFVGKNGAQTQMRIVNGVNKPLQQGDLGLFEELVAN